MEAQASMLADFGGVSRRDLVRPGVTLAGHDRPASSGAMLPAHAEGPPDGRQPSDHNRQSAPEPRADNRRRRRHSAPLGLPQDRVGELHPPRGRVVGVLLGRPRTEIQFGWPQTNISGY
jgi:hypothetical protein